MKCLIQHFALCIFLILFSSFLTPGVYSQSEINKTEKISGEKSTIFRFDKIRSGAIKTDKGWNVQDFATSLFNPDSEEITVTWKMISDDPKFVFANGQVGTYTKTYKLKPMSGITDNVYMSPIFVPLKRDWPVGPNSNFVGTAEFSSAKPFYFFLLHETPEGVSSDRDSSYFIAWNPCDYKVPGPWDNDLKQFVIPYTNYWHNEKTFVPGWYSEIVLSNNTDHFADYTLKHIPYYGSFYDQQNDQSAVYKEQVVHLELQKHEKKTITLMELFGWPTHQMSAMEGCLLISPDRRDATESGTTAYILIFPNESGKPIHAIF
ncbi:MAG: hypothetical protein P4L45_03995 [Ignavibacteriaceae bacterium]|nr:hypothetical protein [Ignavibacteriaceae bacterium]